MNILSDSNPTFAVPFCFAGSLHDRDNNLVRFGYRDYDPEVGRWTAKDPIGFAGGDVDIWGYTQASPVNYTDPLGLWDERVHRPSGTQFIDDNYETGPFFRTGAKYHFGVDRNWAELGMNNAASEQEYNTYLHAWEDSFNPAHSGFWNHALEWLPYYLSFRNDNLNPDSPYGPYDYAFRQMEAARAELPSWAQIQQRRSSSCTK